MKTRRHTRPRSRDAYPSVETVLRRTEKLSTCLSLFHTEVARSLAVNPEAEWIFGRLYLLGLLNDEQYAAAMRIDNLLKRYRSLLAPHGRIRAWRPENLRATRENLSPEEMKRMLVVRAEYEKMFSVLKQAGPAVVNCVFTMIDTDVAGELSLVYKGLNAMLVG